MSRTHYCGEVNFFHIGAHVIISGWIHSIRRLKNLTFLDIRDRTGIIQAVCSKKLFPSIFLQSLKLNQEFCIRISGKVREKRKKISESVLQKNIEVLVHSINILNNSKNLPIDIIGRKISSEEMQLKYRYLYLRNPDMNKTLVIRSEITHFIHQFMHKNKFVNIETPYLSNPTDGGAKDFLVPSRTKHNHYYALAQSPQMFKQILMISGFDRYYQIAKCFRDEDSRSNRQPEFTQLDMEMSFVNSKKIKKIIERFIRKLWKKILKYDLPNCFPTITFEDAIQKYGTDKPDLRNPLELVDITYLTSSFDKSERKFSNEDSCILIHIKQVLRDIKSIQFKKYQRLSLKFKIKNFLILEFSSDFLNQTVKKNLLDFPVEFFYSIRSNFQIKEGDVICVGIGKKPLLNQFMGCLRSNLAKELDISEKNVWKPIWVIDFPMFKEEKDGCLKPVHHVFTSPKLCDISKLYSNPIRTVSDSYDMVINGQELGSGSVRIYKKEIQEKIFQILKINEEDQKNRFGFFLEAMQYGVPPHAGFAFGLDRIVMLMLNQKNIKNVIAFPKTTSASCLMTNSPSKI
ncbi:aspartate--tRNA ligase [Candidatus Riesia pediculicola]|uniref:aspartate--tRNA ligase n=1 Tax=Candidatus Riesia pediculicola TaxID=401619 RepID=UPI0009C37D10|nr:aspartate--tRNA ligase [Candidatus Riesia pediculicola]ARC54247.1 hypothetical protein AOE57_01385 [Candidatus Riesia pediculicola]